LNKTIKNRNQKPVLYRPVNSSGTRGTACSY